MQPCSIQSIARPRFCSLACIIAACGIPVIGKKDWDTFVQTGELKGLQGHHRMLDEKLLLRSETEFLHGCVVADQIIRHLISLAKGLWTLQEAGKKTTPQAASKAKKKSRGRPHATKVVPLTPGDGRARTVLWKLFQDIRSIDRDGEAGVGHVRLRR